MRFGPTLLALVLVAFAAAAAAKPGCANKADGLGVSVFPKHFDLASKDVSCDTCVGIVDYVAKATETATTLENLSKTLQWACQTFFKDEKRDQCLKISADLIKVLPSITKALKELAWDPRAFCATIVPVCKLPCCSADNTPEQIHLGIGDRPDVITVTWTTLSSLQNATVSFGYEGHALNRTVRAGSRTYTDGGWVGMIHSASLVGLAPGQRVSYRVSGGVDAKQTWSPVYTFSTLPANVGTDARPLRIVQIGDVDFAKDGAPTLAAVSRLVDAGQVDVVLHVGDIGYADGYEAHWDAFLTQIQPVASRVPYLVGPGNHEFWFEFSSYKQRFTMPQHNSTKNMYYSLPLGRNLHLQMLNSETVIDTADFDDAQLKWIAGDLAAARDKKWKITTFHRPLYCTNHVKMQCEVFAGLLRGKAEKHLAGAGVDLVINAHVHAYERTWPVVDGVVQAQSYHNAPAPTYIVNGAGGNREGNRKNEADKPWSAKVSSEVGFMTIVVTDAAIRTDFISSATGAVIDTVEFTK